MRTSAFIVALATVTNAAYTLRDAYDASNFFSEFTYFTAPDPTYGFVKYQSMEAANATSLTGLKDNAVYLGVDSTTVNPVGGRASTRVSSNKLYNKGLFIADIAHLPESQCGVWPAFWSVSKGTETWPAGGEIDIIEGVNEQTTNIVTLHTSAGATCELSTADSLPTTKQTSTDCNLDEGHTGCSSSTTDPQNYGTGFNAVGGGVYAMEWTSAAIKIWHFPRNAIPADITALTPNPSSWRTPTATYQGANCNIEQHFKDHSIIFDTTFCGAWAGAPSVWAKGNCAAQAATCEQFVAENPSAFIDAYWQINSVNVFQTS